MRSDPHGDDGPGAQGEDKPRLSPDEARRRPAEAVAELDPVRPSALDDDETETGEDVTMNPDDGDLSGLPGPSTDDVSEPPG